MKKLATSVAAAAAVALLMGGCGGNDGGSGAGSGGNGGGGDDKGKITIGIKYDQPGLGIMQGNTPKGFDVSVAEYVVGKLGYEPDQIEWEESVSANRETMLETKAVDLIFATYSITDERKQKVAFAGPYLVAGQDFLVLADNTDITGPESLDGKKLCSVQGSTPAARIKDEYSKGVELVEFQTYSECMDALIGGQIDALTTDDSILAGFAAQEAYQGKVKLVGKPFSQEYYGVGLAKTDPKATCEDIDKALTEMFDSGEWSKALESNLGTYSPNPEFNDPSPKLDKCA
ncbi:MAG: glutamate ABC transporter substrate-binding protein [Bifidobacteriaceae bacterium]|jgi:glutamate transport system substrate-binding protein|nr:glutamate ABC transporter substrate-binding protein [Bifidobacteriaceae bacterium]